MDIEVRGNRVGADVNDESLSSSNGNTSSSMSIGSVTPDLEFGELSDIGVFQIFKKLIVVNIIGV